MHSDFYSMFVARLLHEIGRNKYRIVNGGGCMKTVNRGRSPVTYEQLANAPLYLWHVSAVFTF